MDAVVATAVSQLRDATAGQVEQELGMTQNTQDMDRAAGAQSGKIKTALFLLAIVALFFVAVFARHWK